MKKFFMLLMAALLLMGVIPAQAETIAFETPALSGDGYRQMLKNPNRGFRLETYLSVGSGKLTSMEEYLRGIIEVFSPADKPSELIYRPEKPDCANF